MTRKSIAKKDSLIVWKRDRWCCRYCGRPVIFAPTMKMLEKKSPSRGYYHPHWKRENAPLLDELGASIDHIHAVSRGGTNSLDNYLTACWKCNVDKNDRPLENWGEIIDTLPTAWDGLSSLFVYLYHKDSADSTEKVWYRLLNDRKQE